MVLMRFLFLAWFAVTAAGCCDCPEEEETIEPTLASIQSNVFSKSCVASGCHDEASKSGGLDLRAGKSHAQLVNVDSEGFPSMKRVVPGNPEKSFLYIKLTHPASGQGSRMPLGGSALSSETMAVIRQWITKGAPK